MKQALKLYLEEKDLKKLKQKAEALGFSGRGCISHYMEKVAREDVCFMDNNVKTILGALQLKIK